MTSLATRIHLKIAGADRPQSLADRPQSNFNMSPELKPPLVDSFSTLATLGGTSALCSVDTPPVYPKLTGCTDNPQTVRGPLADRPLYILQLKHLSAQPLVTNLMNGGPSASYLRTIRTTKFQTTQNFTNFHNFNF